MNKLKHKITYTIMGLWLLVGIIGSSGLVRAAEPVEYNVETGDFFYYECTFAQKSIETVQIQNEDPVNTTMIKVDIKEALLTTNAEKTHASGSISVDIWFMAAGQNWQQTAQNLPFLLDSDPAYLETFGSIGFEDADVNASQIQQFFTDTPIFIPNPSALSDAQWTALKQNLEGNIIAAYGYETLVAEIDKGDRKFTINGVGQNPATDYILVMTYSSEGYLKEYKLYAEYLGGEDRDTMEHIIFKAEYIDTTTEVPQLPPENEWIPWAIAGGIAVAALIIIAIWRRNR